MRSGKNRAAKDLQEQTGCKYQTALNLLRKHKGDFEAARKELAGVPDDLTKKCCFNCSVTCDQDEFCFGCGEYICNNCDVGFMLGKGHDPVEHLEEEQEEEQEDE